MFPEEPDEEDCRSLIKEKVKKLDQKGSVKDLKDYTLIKEELYRRLPEGILSRCVSEKEGKRKLEKLHNQTCGIIEKISLYQRIQCMDTIGLT